MVVKNTTAQSVLRIMRMCGPGEGLTRNKIISGDWTQVAAEVLLMGVDSETYHSILAEAPVFGRGARLLRGDAADEWAVQTHPCQCQTGFSILGAWW
jgi:hypothetical protein